MKILHLTDLHIGGAKTPDMEDRVRHLVRKLTVDRGTLPDLARIAPPELPVVITGDLIDQGRSCDSLAQARAILVDPLIQFGYPLFVVPGNHDYGTGSAASRHAGRRFHDLLYNEVFASALPEYPVVRWVNQDMAFIGLNSMEEEVNDDADGEARGRLGYAQLNRLKAILSSCQVRQASQRIVYLHHHPFLSGLTSPWMALDDTRDLQKIMAGHHIDLLLFGHKHKGGEWHGEIGIAKVYDGGTSTAHKAKDPARRTPHHRLIELTSPDPRDDVDLNLLRDYPGPGAEGYALGAGQEGMPKAISHRML